MASFEGLLRLISNLLVLLGLGLELMDGFGSSYGSDHGLGLSLCFTHCFSLGSNLDFD